MSSEALVDYHGLQGSRAVIVLFGDSLTQRGFEMHGWASQVANHYGRRADIFNRGYGGYNSRWGRGLATHLFPTPLPSSSLASLFSNREETEKYFLTTVWFGANDASTKDEKAHVPLLEFEDNIAAIIAHLQDFFLHVVVMSPPPVHAASRLAWKQEKFGVDSEEGKTIERSTHLAGQYGRAAGRAVAKRNTLRNEKRLGAGATAGSGAEVMFLDIWTEMLEQDGGEDTWSTFLQNDGLHLSTLGQDFVAQRLLHLLDTSPHIRAVEDIPSELPWGSQVNPLDFETSFRDHQAKFTSDRVGLGRRFFASASSLSSQHSEHTYGIGVSSNSDKDGSGILLLMLSVLVLIVFLCGVLYTFFSYFGNVGYFRINKEN